jgi:hypothetical protein
MATKDRDWPMYNQWYCCPSCRRLWTYQGKDVVALDSTHALGPAFCTEGIPARTCVVCEGEAVAPVAEI